ncbi:methylmalonyl-CoA epimerase [Haloarcula sp. JP-Z28]|uniref:Lactoylglutathione lyase and related lyases n=1 Tax=Haloarcula marismortui (strain ATCC 43049 / DSM 3752 / JCM 8966 / VKM B-1809) TaxID=272569 RepID=Q5V4A9_HALMA|nr:MULTISPECIES: methylmalonyl-CoA epimerase [Haloarcula]AAV45643.1 lactoylglutathione lyase and related lyases [Haloarcula marismortui ATCC 43049]NHN64970.1 methylmalonyl-CoA epimerase [Haloarcula sp. JP-Z28]QCP90425.1 methylmalonyl-CoA epimerase [Haloarcula marismortui ATCC 43049]
MQFDHAGIATDDAAPLAELFAEAFETPVVHDETFDGLQVTFLEMDNGYFELLEPLPDADGAIPRYLDSNGPGIHHVALETDDIAAALETVSDCGIDLIDEEPRPGAWGHDVAFLHPKTTGGVLVELVEH